MTDFMANWEVESDITLPKSQSFVRYDHPEGKYTIFLRPTPTEKNDPVRMLMQVLFDAPSIAEADDVSEEFGKEFLDYLTFASNLRTRLGKLKHIFNWEPAQQGVMRDAIYFNMSPADDAPYEVLDTGLLDTLGFLQSKPVSTRVRRALKWFANGVAAQYQDDKFAFFWFVLEVVALVVKTAAPVPDKCPKCRTPLFCPACNASHLHRPYPKQAIEELFQRLIKDTPDDFFKQVSRARNMLMHGEELRSIEEELRVEFATLVDKMGRLAWIAIVNQFSPVLGGKRVQFIQTSKYVRMNLSFSANFQFGYTPDFENPDPAALPHVQMTMHYADEMSGAEPTGK
jgi:hypothetical protein